MTVSLSPLAGAGWQFCDENGNPLVGGLLYTYQGGTTTPSPTYTNNAGNVTNTNPIVLDSAGRPPNEVWLVSTDSYKFALKTSTGIDVWTQDNIYGVASSALIEGLSGPNGSNLIGFIQSGAGAVARTVQTKLREWVSITDYGASPSTTTATNNVAIQAALTEANVRKCAVYVPGANSAYRVSDEFTIPSGVTVWGDGYSSLIQQTIAGKNIFIAGNDTVVRDLHLKMCAGNNLNIQKQHCVAIPAVTNVSVLNNWLELVDINCGVFINQAKDVYINGNIIYGGTWNTALSGAAANASDILLYSQGANVGRTIITNNFCFSNNSQGIFTDSLGFDGDITVSNNICITLDPSTCVSGGAWSEMPNGGARRHGIMSSYLYRSVETNPRIVISNNVCRNTIWTGIYLPAPNAGPVIIANNVCSYNGYQTSNTLSGGIYVNCTGSALVSGNYVYNFQNTAGSGGLTLNASTASTTNRTRVVNNVIKGSLGYGIYVGTNAALLDIIGNTISDCVNTDINITPASGNANVGGHVVAGNTIYRTSGSAVPSIVFSLQASTKTTVIRDNYMRGYDNTTANILNSGIRVITTNQTYVWVSNNQIINYYYGVVYASFFAASTRAFDLICENNFIRDCNTGIVAIGVNNFVTVPLVNNRFVNVTFSTSAAGLGYTCGYIGTKEGSKIVAELAAAPIVGTWAVGDRVMFTAPASGGYIGSVCTVAGGPGTWKSFGLIA